MCTEARSKPDFCHIGIQKTQTGVWQLSASQRTLGWKNWAKDEPNNAYNKEDKGSILTITGDDNIKTFLLALAISVLIATNCAVLVALLASMCVVKGLRQKRKCSVVSAAITDGVCACCIISGGVGAMVQPGWAMPGMISVVSGIPMVVASVISCTQCGSVQPRCKEAAQFPPVVGEPVVGG